MDSFKEVDDSDNDSSSSEELNRATGLCHHNKDGKEVEFSIDLLGQSLVLFQDPSCKIKELGHGAVIWDAAVVFAKYLEIDSTFSGAKVEGKRVIELGSGPGLAGLSLMLKGCACTLTDLEPVVKHMTAPNAERTFAKLASTSPIRLVRPVTEVIDWTATYPPPAAPYDIILLTDCVFSAALAGSLVQQLLRLSGPNTLVICCHEIRDEEANAAFVAAFSTHFAVKTVPKKKLHPDYCNDMIKLLHGRLRRARKT